MYLVKEQLQKIFTAYLKTQQCQTSRSRIRRYMYPMNMWNR